jgi:hypothetical protein
MASELRKLLTRQARDLLDLEKGQVRKAFALYRGFRADLIDRLDFLDEARLKLTATRYSKALDQVGDALSDLRQGFTGQLGESVRPIAELAKRHLIEQVAAFGKRFPGALDIKPTIGKPLEAAVGILTPQFESSVDGYTSKIETDIRQRLAMSLMADEDGQAARARVVPGYLPPVSKQGDPPTVAYWAQKIVTDQATRASGVVKLQMIEQGSNQKLQKRWCSVLDERTSAICEEMDGQVVDIDEPFTRPDGEEVMSPPAHPNCRAFVIPWTDEVAPAAAEIEGTSEGPAEEKKPAQVAANDEPAKVAVALDPALAVAPEHPSQTLARQHIAIATGHDKEVTEAMHGLEGEDAELVGLKFRVKSEGSLARKILGDAAEQPDRSLADIAASNKDNLRYTLQIDPAKYAEQIPQHLRALEEQGYTVTSFKNTWGPDKAYQGVNTNLKTPDGYTFELQFHTADSFNMKENVNHKLYEEHRLTTTPAERKSELWQQMIDNQATIDRPPGAEGLKFVPKELLGKVG